jgi:carboxyl-terminal processing protease
MKKLTSENVLDIYLNALAHVYDPHSDYLGREEMDDFSIAMNLSLFGIGATLTERRTAIAKYPILCPAARRPGAACSSRATALSRSGKGMGSRWTSWTCRCRCGEVDSRRERHARPPDAHSRGGTADASVAQDHHARARRSEAGGSAGEGAHRGLATNKRTTLRLGVIDLPAFYGSFDQARRTPHPAARRPMWPS